MNPWIFACAFALMLVGPWLLRPETGVKPEIHGGLRFLSWVNAAYCGLWHRLETRRAPLPAEGGAILIANHTCAIDHLLLQAGCERVLGFLIAREYFEHWAIRPFCRWLRCIPVRRDGHDLAATRAALRALEDGRVVPIFPEGKILPLSGRALGQAKPGVAFLALHSRVPVIPAYICGTPETNQVARSLATPSRARVIYGTAVDLSDIDATPPFQRQTLEAVTERLMGAIRALQEQSRREREDGRGTITSLAD